jgi:hypothetical protein
MLNPGDRIGGVPPGRDISTQIFNGFVQPSTSPDRAELSRTEPNRTEPSQAEPNRAEPSQADVWTSSS